VASWAEFSSEQPELAARVRERLEAGTHKTLATVRASGAPRVAGNEAWIAAGELWFGSMAGSARARDLRRDPRFALHTASADPPGWAGDASLSGRAEEVEDAERVAVAVAPLEQVPDGPWHLFRADLEEVLLVAMGEPADHLEIAVWRPGEPVRRLRR
jgi:Pyridoxamine 5'-phosphate oxidase